MNPSVLRSRTQFRTSQCTWSGGEFWSGVGPSPDMDRHSPCPRTFVQRATTLCDVLNSCKQNEKKPKSSLGIYSGGLNTKHWNTERFEAWISNGSVLEWLVITIAKVPKSNKMAAILF